MPEETAANNEDNTREQETIVENNGAMSLEEQAAMKAQLGEERQLYARVQSDLAAKDQRIAILEADVSARETELATAKQAAEQSAAVIAELQQQTKVSLDKYRQALVAGHPDIPESLISGDSFQTLFDSVEKGKAVVAAVSEKLKAAAAASTVPAGAPERGELALNGLSPREKISAGIKPKGIK
jgi:hypothetical protein